MQLNAVDYERLHNMLQSPENKKDSTERDEQLTYDTGIVAVTNAGREVLRFWPNHRNPYFDRAAAEKALAITKEKPGASNYATLADELSEKIINTTIRETFPDHTIFGEETGKNKGNSEYWWADDPIDGTMRFRNGSETWGISAGLFRGNEPVAGFIALPASQEVIAARKGHGAKLISFDGEELADLSEILASEATIDKALIGADYGYEERGGQITEYTAKIADKIGYPISYGSCSYLNGLLALGEIQGYFCEGPTIFDVAGAAAILPEVGGVVTNMQGNPIDWKTDWKQNPQSYLAARTPELHHQLLELLNK